METEKGGNARNMKSRNRLLALKLLCLNGPLSRSEIADATGLTRMTTGNIVSELIAGGLVREEKEAGKSSPGAGRKAGLLDLSPASPAVCGIFIGRRHCAVLLGDLKCRILAQESVSYGEDLDGKALIDTIVNLFYKLVPNCGRPVLGAGISALGPLDAGAGMLLAPPNFYGIRNLPVRELLSQALGLPCLLLHDCSAAALAENLYGGGPRFSNFMFLQIQDGIGAGIVANGDLFHGDMGLGGEIGHTSINFDGPPCPCGGRGCLELYANERNVVEQVRRLSRECGPSPLLEREPLTLRDIVAAANARDCIAVAALDSFCEYVSVALVNSLNLVDTHMVFVGYDGEGGDILERLLESKVNRRLLASERRHVRVERSRFGTDAPVYGAVALAAQKVFAGELPLPGLQ